MYIFPTSHDHVHLFTIHEGTTGHSPVHPDGDHVESDLEQAVDVLADESRAGQQHLTAR